MPAGATPKNRTRLRRIVELHDKKSWNWYEIAEELNSNVESIKQSYYYQRWHRDRKIKTSQSYYFAHKEHLNNLRKKKRQGNFHLKRMHKDFIIELIIEYIDYGYWNWKEIAKEFRLTEIQVYSKYSYGKRRAHNKMAVRQQTAA